MKLIADWRNWHRFRSVQWGALGIVCGAALKGYSQLGDWAPNLQHYVPGWALHAVTVLFFASPFMSLLSRAIDQPNLPPSSVVASNNSRDGE